MHHDENIEYNDSEGALRSLSIPAQFYDVQNCNSVQIVHPTYAAKKAKLINYFATALQYYLY